MLRIALFFATNIAILVVISIVFRLLGFEGILAENQVDLNLQALLVMSAVIGFSGGFADLFLSHPPLRKRIAALEGHPFA